MKKILFFLILLFPVYVCAELYQWVDENGVYHFTDNNLDVPEKYQKSLPEPKSGITNNRIKNSATDEIDQPSETPPYVLEGRIIDTNRLLLQGSMDEGEKWDGTFDAVGLKVIFIKAYQHSVMIQSVHPDGNGMFSLTLNKPTTHITLENPGGGLYVRNNGPWKENAQTDFSLDSGLFSVNGYVRGITDTPVGRIMVSAFDEQGGQITYCYTDSTGYFQFNTNYPITVLKTRADGLEIVRQGSWNRNATVLLTPEKRTLFTISGTVLDQHNQPVEGVRISSFVTGGNGKSAMTDSRGYYEIMTDRTINGLYAYRALTGDEIRKNGPWDENSQVNFVLSKGNVFTISGQVTDNYGQTVYNAFVFATDDMGSRHATTRTDRNGNYTLNLAKEVVFMNAYRSPMQPKTTVPGPWNQDATVDIQLTQ